MSKRMVWAIVVLMSISLIGIVAVQVYWVQDAINNKRLQFRNNITIALAGTAETIREKEKTDTYTKYSKFFETNSLRTKAEVNNFLFQQVDTLGNKKFVYGTFLDEQFKIPTGFTMPDSTFVRKITRKNNVLSVKIIGDGKDFGKTFQEDRFSEFKRDIDFEKEQLTKLFQQEKRLLPIHKRVNNRELQFILEDQLAKRGINLDFKYGVYKNGMATSLKSGYFKINLKEDFFYPLFEDESGNSSYRLYINFPNEDKSIISNLMKVLILSIFFILLIISIFGFSVYQLIRQKKISEIKTNFINNMTHEFKTPIATINLALDAIKNPKIINDNEQVKRYVQLIRDENKRMHSQVESVLRISKLEKNQIDIDKQAVDMSEVLEEAIEHVYLLVQDKKGTIDMSTKALTTEVLGNQFHLTNVVVNMLENAIKYSKQAPIITIITQSTNKNFIFKIKDQGIGMSKQAQKHVFEKFYREEVGNVHNVKGHGLGLAYVKEIIDNHHGTVYVESEKGKGSVFTVKLPLI